MPNVPDCTGPVKPTGLQFLPSLGVNPATIISKVDGSIAPALANIVTVLQQAHAVRGAYVSEGTMSPGTRQRIWRVRPLPGGLPVCGYPQPDGSIYADELTALQLWLEQALGFGLAAKDVERAVMHVARSDNRPWGWVRDRLAEYDIHFATDTSIKGRGIAGLFTYN